VIAEAFAAETIVPKTLDEAVAAMRESARDKTTVAFVGGGTDFGYGRIPDRVGMLLKTEKLDRVVDYAPADMTITVEAGVTLAALQRTLAVNNQRLALDPPQPERATIGGLLAANTYGPLRARYGTLRDLIVGIEMIRADGARARGGGKVVKNVAGFDLPKLLVGSLGTLACIASATFRLHPFPERRRWVSVPARSLEEVRVLYRALVERRLEAAALLAAHDGDSYTLYVLFEGFGPSVAAQETKFAALVGELFAVDARALDDDAEPVGRDAQTRSFGSVRLRISTAPALLPLLERSVLNPLRAAFEDARLVVYPSLGVVFVSGSPGDPSALAAEIERARARVESGAGHLVLLECADSVVRGRVDPFGTPPESFSIMQRLKERFDPERRLNPGRFVGGL
jgi:glycolate oxidase FAD binding subunit